MNEITREEAILQAKKKLEINVSLPANAWRVRRLDRKSEAYYIVQIGYPNDVEGVVTVDASTGEIGNYASLQKVRAHVVVDAKQAIEIAGGGAAAEAEMVWMPCSASKSPLYPFWLVKTGTMIKYVDLHGKIFNQLDPPALGGFKINSDPK